MAKQTKPDSSMTNPNLMPWHDMNERQVQASAARYTGTVPKPRLRPPQYLSQDRGTGTISNKRPQTGSYDARNKSRAGQRKNPDQAQSEYNADQQEFDPAVRGPYNHMMDEQDFVPQPNTPEQQQSIDLLIQQLMQLRNQ